MIKRKDIEEIDLKEDYVEFCNSQYNCSVCILVEKEIINNTYDQPCTQVYSLLRMIKE